MMKRSTVLAFGFAALAAMLLSNPAAASTINSLNSNGLQVNGLMSHFVTLQAVKLALPDGTELTFR